MIDPGCKSGEEECKEQIFTVAIHQAGFCLPLCVRAWGENNIKEEEVYYETERMWNWNMGQKEEGGYTMRQKTEGAV